MNRSYRVGICVSYKGGTILWVRLLVFDPSPQLPRSIEIGGGTKLPIYDPRVRTALQAHHGICGTSYLHACLL